MTGNCQVASLIDGNGTHVWTCMPRFDGDPVFCDLLSGSDAPDRPGRWAIELLDQATSLQTYERNTAIVETTLTDSHGAVLVITDFCPRFRQYDRNFRPAVLVRMVRRLAGRPRSRLAPDHQCQHRDDLRTARVRAGGHAGVRIRTGRVGA
jgi:hypothetical protein